MIIYAHFIRIFSFFSVGIVLSFVSLKDGIEKIAPATASVRLLHFYFSLYFTTRKIKFF